jgi:hypothetical protein
VAHQRMERFRRQTWDDPGEWGPSAFALRAPARQAGLVSVPLAFLGDGLPSTSTGCSFRHGLAMIPASAHQKQS